MPTKIMVVDVEIDYTLGEIIEELDPQDLAHVVSMSLGDEKFLRELKSELSEIDRNILVDYLSSSWVKMPKELSMLECDKINCLLNKLSDVSLEEIEALGND